MADDFRVLRSGSELSGNGVNNPHTGGKTNWWLWGIGIAASLAIVGGIAYQAGRKSVIPPVASASDEKSKAEKEAANNPTPNNASAKTG